MLLFLFFEGVVLFSPRLALRYQHVALNPWFRARSCIPDWVSLFRAGRLRNCPRLGGKAPPTRTHTVHTSSCKIYVFKWGVLRLAVPGLGHHEVLIEGLLLPTPPNQRSPVNAPPARRKSRDHPTAPTPMHQDGLGAKLLSISNGS